VNAEYLRFDFSHFQKMTEEELQEVESRVNRMIIQGVTRNENRAIPMEEARKMGAMALFGEKYGDQVRVIRFGDSVELCGGTHVDSTSQIGLFKIISEGSIATGIRRVEAITGERALAWYRNKENTLRKIEETLSRPQDILKAIVSLVAEKNSLQKQVDKYTRELAVTLKEDLSRKIIKSDSYSLIKEKADDRIDNIGIIKDLAFQLKGEIKDLVLVIGAVLDEKPTLVVALSDFLIREKKLHAGEIVKIAAKEFEGGGGGQPFYATAGGKNPGNLDKAMDKAVSLITQVLDNK
jgi:alanyl-tRNA synthetase